jgi:hypothetical protein
LVKSIGNGWEFQWQKTEAHPRSFIKLEEFVILFKHSMYQKVVLKLSDFHLYVLVVIGVVTIISILLGLRWRARFPQMSGMIISMFLGMRD